ncbi:MAG: GntR family transcriptional regulator [Clostridiales bacterium]|nr:GntR family transcriptional regulator [Clostridiales bacterium]MDY6146351.1 GntR family transcriptional regulator [Peptoniphilaceae bacterium]
MEERRGLSLYRYVYSALLEDILGGKYKVGCVLPSEKDLEQRFSVSRITIRRAVDDLQKDNIVLKQPGIGTLVLDNKIPLQLSGISGFRDENTHLSEWTSSILISCKKIHPALKVRTALQLNGSTLVYCLERIRLLKNERVGFHRAYFPESIVTIPEGYFSHEKASLYDLFKAKDLYPYKAHERISAILPSDEIVRYLKIDKNLPVLFKERQTFSKENRPIEFVEVYYRGDRYQYEVQIVDSRN